MVIAEPPAPGFSGHTTGADVRPRHRSGRPRYQRTRGLASAITVVADDLGLLNQLDAFTPAHKP